MGMLATSIIGSILNNNQMMRKKGIVRGQDCGELRHIGQRCKAQRERKTNKNKSEHKIIEDLLTLIEVPLNRTKQIILNEIGLLKNVGAQYVIVKNCISKHLLAT